jgi:hypothetical protein
VPRYKKAIESVEEALARLRELVLIDEKMTDAIWQDGVKDALGCTSGAFAILGLADDVRKKYIAKGGK